MTRIIITGSKGRMGRALVSCAPHHPEIQIVGQIDQGDDLRNIIANCDVVVDFSSHSATPAIAALCAEHKKGIVIGTTGHSDEGKSQIEDFRSQIPIVIASNFSTGVNALFWLTRKAAEILADVRKKELAKVARHGREGIVGERTNEEIGIHSLRGGDVVGDHTVVFASSGERVELTHKASSRETFANGALRAAVWVMDQKPGLYDMQDVLGLK